MKMKTGLFGRAMSFAHLAGVKPSAKRAEEEETPKGKRAKAEDDEDEDKAEDPDEEEETPKGKKARRAKAEDDEDEDKAEDEDDEDKAEDPDEEEDKAEDPDEEDEPPKGRKAKAAKPTAEFNRGRKAERQRCARIFGSPAAGRNPAAAAELAFNTNLTSSQAISVLKTQGPAAGRSRANPDLGADRDRTERPGGQASSGWDKAFAKAGAGGAPKAKSGWDKAFGAVGGR